MNINTISKVWAMIPEHLRALTTLDTPEVSAELKATNQARSQQRSANKVRVLPLFGTITQRPSFLSDLFGGTSTNEFTKAFDSALADETVKAVVIEIDSPGGSVSGVDELSRHIYAARGTKPILAIANSLAASAAYWVGSAADELHVTPSGQVGAVGVVAVHEDWSGALDKAGIKPTFITAGAHKAEGNSAEPLTDDAREELQAQVDHAYDMFVTALARNRGATKAMVRDNYGQGRVLNAKAAVAAGMADSVATIDDVIKRAGSSHARTLTTLRGAKATLDLYKALYN
ncbi:MAG: hypothetical protein DHS20C16_03480 [Phycisphaerae bacterium]|nr:MAG: hypothetical protein DHS20C16_03480 [Phycisphaerae bacterium]